MTTKGNRPINDGAASQQTKASDLSPIIPDAPAKSVAYVGNLKNPTRLVNVRCPICHKTHVHGWPLTTPAVGTRTSHCGKGGKRATYRVTGEHALDKGQTL